MDAHVDEEAGLRMAARKRNKIVSKVAKRKPTAHPTPKRARTPSVGQCAIAGLREGLTHLRGEHVAGLVVRKAVDVAAHFPQLRSKQGAARE